ncbi:MAG: SURF1 family protein [Acidimicrobiia bacterium]|nr:SURF1 family protein [Acidimicrobiia bacterium]
MSFRFLLRPRWLAWTALVVVACVVMLNLAGWQFQRLDERRDRNEQFLARADQPMVDADEVLAPVGGDVDPTLEWRRVRAEGTYDIDGEVLISHRTFDSAPGWWVVTPLVLDDGTALAVNRGWIPFNIQPDDDRSAFAPPPGRVQVSGLLQPDQDRVAGPMDDPKVLPRVHLAELDRRSDVAVLGMWLQLEMQDPPVVSDELVLLPLPELTDGPHLNYAGQWLIFTTLTLVVYGVLVVRVARNGGDRDRDGGGAGSAPGVGPEPDGDPVDRGGSGVVGPTAERGVGVG